MKQPALCKHLLSIISFESQNNPVRTIIILLVQRGNRGTEKLNNLLQDTQWSWELHQAVRLHTEYSAIMPHCLLRSCLSQEYTSLCGPGVAFLEWNSLSSHKLLLSKDRGTRKNPHSLSQRSHYEFNTFPGSHGLHCTPRS